MPQVIPAELKEPPQRKVCVQSSRRKVCGQSPQRKLRFNSLEETLNIIENQLTSV